MAKNDYLAGISGGNELLVNLIIQKIDSFLGRVDLDLEVSPSRISSRTFVEIYVTLKLMIPPV